MSTETTMETHGPLGFTAALGRQLRLLWIGRRPVLLLLALLAVLILAGEPWSDNEMKARLLTPWLVWLIVVGPLWALTVFHNEGPSNRLYHWSLPVDRWRHTLARLAAGLLWLWAGYVVLIAFGALMGAADGNLHQLGELHFSAWVNFFTGPMLGYLLISFLTIGSDHPIRWFLGILFSIPFALAILDDVFDVDIGTLTETIFYPLGVEEWGLFPVMIGEFGRAVLELEASLAGGEPPEFFVTYWWPAMIGWTLLLVVALAFLASRHPDTLPRLSRGR